VDICLMIEGQENVTWEQWVALAMACEEHNFDALFRSDHYLSFGHPKEWGNLDAWTTLAGLAAVTQRVRLGTLVSPVTFRHPSVLAKSVLTVDHISGGRAELGMGAGWFDGEHTAYGFPFPSTRERFELLEEQVQIVHQLIEREVDEVSFEGTYFRLEGGPSLPKSVQDPHPPLIIGGRGGSFGLHLAAWWADEYNVFGVGPQGCVPVRKALSAACDEAQRDPGEVRLSTMTGVLVGSNQKELEERGARLMERTGDDGDVRAFIESWGERRIVGTVDQVLERLGEFAKGGVERIMLQHLVHEDLETVAQIGTDIIPAGADL
jgi:F420-dependent oxidoreductase-like protein